MEEEKFPTNPDVIFVPKHTGSNSIHKAKQEWMARLESDVQAIKKSEEANIQNSKIFLSRTPAGKALYEKMQKDPNQQKLKNLHAESYQKIEQTLREGRTNFQQISQSVASLVQDYQTHIQTLQKQTAHYQEEMSDLKREQQNLIKNSLVLFAHHKNQLEKLFQQLAGIPSFTEKELKKLFDDANEQIEKLEKENTKKLPRFELCNTYFINANTLYQKCYVEIIQFIEPQFKQYNSAAADLKSAGIDIDGTSVLAGGNIHMGHSTTIIYQTADREIKEIIELQNKFFGIKQQYDVLQQNYQKKEEELALNQEALKRQQAEWEQEFFEQTTKAETVKTAIEKQATEQAKKIKVARQEIESAEAEAEQAKKKIEIMQWQITQLEVEVSAKTAQQEDFLKREQALFEQIARSQIAAEKQAAEQSKKADFSKQETDNLKAKAEQTEKQMEAMQQRIMQLEAEGAAKTEQIESTKKTKEQSKQALLQSVLCDSRYDGNNALTLVLQEINNEKISIRSVAVQTVTILARNSYFTDSQFEQFFTAASIILQDKDWRIRQNAVHILADLARNPHCTKQHFSRLFIITITILQDADMDKPIRQDVLHILADLARNPHFAEQHFVQLFTIATAALQDVYMDQRIRQDALLILADLARNPHCTEQHFAQLIAIATAALQDVYMDQRIRQDALRILPDLARNPHCTEQHFAQLITIATAALQDERIRQDALLILADLAKNPHCTGQYSVELSVIANTVLENGDPYITEVALHMLFTLKSKLHHIEPQFDQLPIAEIDADLQQATLETISVLASNSNCIESHFTQLLADVTIALKNEDQYVREGGLQNLVDLVGNPDLATQQATEIHSVILCSLKDEFLFWDISDKLIEVVKECSLDQLPPYTALANAVMQDAGTYVQLTAISMLAIIQQRCRIELESETTLENKAESKGEEVLGSQAAAAQNAVAPQEQVRATAQSTPAEAATVMGFLPRPKEQAPDTGPKYAAAIPAPVVQSKS
jgi:hypothetical protein